MGIFLKPESGLGRVWILFQPAPPRPEYTFTELPFNYH